MRFILAFIYVFLFFWSMVVLFILKDAGNGMPWILSVINYAIAWLIPQILLILSMGCLFLPRLFIWPAWIISLLLSFYFLFVIPFQTLFEIILADNPYNPFSDHSIMGIIDYIMKNIIIFTVPPVLFSIILTLSVYHLVKVTKWYNRLIRLWKLRPWRKGV